MPWSAGFSRALPVVRSLYRTSKQVTETILSERGRAFRKVVVLRYPHEKSWSVAFGSAPPPPEIRQHLGEDCETFFLPAVPNPTTGFLLFAEPGQWRDTEMGMEEALKFIVSGGILRRAEGAHRKRTDEGRFGRWAQRGFLRGLLIGVPVFVTLWLCWRVAAFVDDLLRPLVPQSLLPANPWIEFPGVGILFTLAALLLLGLMVRGWLGRVLIAPIERLFARLPLVGGVYSAFKTLIDNMFSRSSRAFREALLFEYPHPGIWGLGFLTSDGDPALSRAASGAGAEGAEGGAGSEQGAVAGEGESAGAGEGASGAPEAMINLFFPTTPNPTTGFFLMVPAARTRRLSMPPDEAMRLILSIGLSGEDGGPSN